MTCNTCKFWSDQIAMLNSHGELTALCLVPREKDSAGLCKYTMPHQSCQSFEAGPSIDEPTEAPA